VAWTKGAEDGEEKEVLADEAVQIERVSTSNSLLTGKLTGNFANLQAPTAEVRRNASRFQYVSDEFPTPVQHEETWWW
jgi:hypothetical protein